MNLKTLTKLAAALALVGFMAVARATTLGFDDRVGSLKPGHPDGDAKEVAYVNNLLGMAAGTLLSPTTATIDGHDYEKVTGDTGSVTLADLIEKNESGDNTGSGTGWLLAKYGKGGGPDTFYVLWKIDGDFEIEQDALSHYDIFGSRQVPDGGATVALLGLGLLGLGAVRRKLS